jgi:hypothetical protein
MGATADARGPKVCAGSDRHGIRLRLRAAASVTGIITGCSIAGNTFCSASVGRDT